MSPKPESGTHDSASRSRAVVRQTWIAVGIAVAIIWLVAGALYLSGSSYVCNLCHEMKPAVSTWRTSAHAKIGCPSCHEPARPTYRFPEALAFRAEMMQRDLSAHFASKTGNVPSASSIATQTIPDSTCLQCHELPRTVTPRSDLLIKHTEHAERNKSCVSCHLWTAHPVPAAERPLLLMAQCFKCHGRQVGAKAPGTCSTCHSSAFNGRPESHQASTWKTAHGKAALANKQPCAMCHEASFCRNCHGLDMPHPADWIKGKPGHSTLGAQDRQICAKCHTQKPDLCSMCHHQDFAPTGGTWIAQHPAMVDKRGASFCLQCHDSLFCFNCHAARGIGGLPTAIGQ